MLKSSTVSCNDCVNWREGDIREGKQGSTVWQKVTSLLTTEQLPGQLGSMRPGSWPPPTSPPSTHPSVQGWEELGEWGSSNLSQTLSLITTWTSWEWTVQGSGRGGASSGSSHSAIFTQQSLILTKQPDFFLKQLGSTMETIRQHPVLFERTRWFQRPCFL